MTHRNSTNDRPHHIDAQDARGGEIILRSRWQRLLFAGGLAAIGFALIVAMVV